MRLEPPNLRYQRAQMLCAELIHRIIPHIDQRGDTDLRAIAREIEGLFVEDGVYVLTDADRECMGLPPRDARGWTPHEVAAYERRMLLDALYERRPFVIEK